MLYFIDRKIRGVKQGYLWPYKTKLLRSQFSKDFSSEDSLKVIESITPNLKLKFGGKLAKTILSMFVE